MKRLWLIFAGLALTGAGVAVAAGTAPPQGTTTISLPQDVGPTLKPGPGVETVQTRCTICHSPAYIPLQPPLTAAQWTAEVTKMQKVYGAPITPEEATTVEEYLVTEYGKQ